MTTASGEVVGLAMAPGHRFSKAPVGEITLVEGIGVRGDGHAGRTVQHRSRVAADPSQPNLRQVHLLHSEFFDLAREQGYELDAGDLGENVLTAGVDLLALPRDTRLRIGEQAVVRVTGLRNPCRQIDGFRNGLLKVAVTRGESGEVVRRAGIMGVVEHGGRVAIGDEIAVVLPSGPHHRLEPV